MVSKLYGAPMSLGELEGLLVERARDFRDEQVDAGDTPLWPKEVIHAWLRRQIEGGGA